MDVCYKNTKHYKTGFCHRGDLSACSFGQKHESHCIKSSSSVQDELLFVILQRWEELQFWQGVP